MDGNRRDSGCRPFFCALCNPQLVRRKAGFHGRVTSKCNLSGERRVFTDECGESTTCPVEGGFSRTNYVKMQLVRKKAGFYGQVTQMTNLSGGRRVLTDEVAFPPLHTRDDLHDEKKQGRAAVGKGDEKVRADAYGEQD